MNFGPTYPSHPSGQIHLQFVGVKNRLILSPGSREVTDGNPPAGRKFFYAEGLDQI
jgi:hypothetical protein